MKSRICYEYCMFGSSTNVIASMYYSWRLIAITLILIKKKKLKSGPNAYLSSKHKLWEMQINKLKDTYNFDC